MWDWGEQFSDKDIALFSNPLYRKQANEFSADPKITRASVIPGAVQIVNADVLKQFFRTHPGGPGHHESVRLSRNIQQMKLNSEISGTARMRRDVSNLTTFLSYLVGEDICLLLV